MSAARRRKKAASHDSATSRRYDERFAQLERVHQFDGVVGWQAPVKYNRCKFCGYRWHCPPDLVDMKIAQGKTGRKIA